MSISPFAHTMQASILSGDYTNYREVLLVGKGEQGGLDAVMVRVRSQNAVLRSTLDSLACARSELAAREAETKNLQRKLEALRAQHAAWQASTSHAAQALLESTPAAAYFAPQASKAVSSLQEAAFRYGGPSPAQSAAGGSGRALSVRARQAAALQALEEQLALKGSRVEALEAALEVAQSHEHEWNHLKALYDSEHALVAAQRQEVLDVRQQVRARALLDHNLRFRSSLGVLRDGSGGVNLSSLLANPSSC
jgi:hypothetical protein